MTPSQQWGRHGIVLIQTRRYREAQRSLGTRARPQARNYRARVLAQILLQKVLALGRACSFHPPIGSFLKFLLSSGEDAEGGQTAERQAKKVNFGIL
jgi:hypothetical protein